MEGILNEEEYSFAKKTYEKEHERLSQLMDEAVQRRTKFLDSISPDNKWMSMMKAATGTTELTQKLVNTMIEKVLIYENGAVEVVLYYGKDWIVVENMHEAIVTHEEFQKVQEILKLGRKRGSHGIQEYPLKGVVRCAECHRIMTRRTGRKGAVYYLCDRSASRPGASCPRGKHFMEADIEEISLPTCSA